MTIFSKIIEQEIPSYKIAEDEYFYAFLDIMPQAKGHVLVVPKMEVDRIFDVPDEYLSRMLVFAKPIAKAIESVIPCKRCGLAVVGLEVPHAHLHIVPLQSADDLNFTRGKLKLEEDEMKSIQAKIVAALQ